MILFVFISSFKLKKLKVVFRFANPGASSTVRGTASPHPRFSPGLSQWKVVSSLQRGRVLCLTYGPHIRGAIVCFNGHINA